MVQTRSKARAIMAEGTGSSRAANKLPNEFFYELLTSLDWSYGELGMLKRVSKGWKGVIDTSPKLDAALFREQPSASPNDPTIKRKLHPLLENIDNILVTSLDHVTIAGSADEIYRAVDLVEAMSQQAFSPPATSVTMAGPLYPFTTVAGGVRVQDFLQRELLRLAKAPLCDCGWHEPTIREEFLEYSVRITGYAIKVVEGESDAGALSLSAVGLVRQR